MKLLISIHFPPNSLKSAYLGNYQALLVKRAVSVYSAVTCSVRLTALTRNHAVTS